MKTYKTKKSFSINNLVYVKCNRQVSLYLRAPTAFPNTTNKEKEYVHKKIQVKDGRVLIIKPSYSWIIRRKYNIRIPI